MVERTCPRLGDCPRIMVWMLAGLACGMMSTTPSPKLVLLTAGSDVTTSIVVQAAVEEMTSSRDAEQTFMVHHVTWLRDFLLTPVAVVQEVYGLTAPETAMVVAVESSCESAHELQSMRRRSCVSQVVRTNIGCDVTYGAGGINVAVNIDDVITVVMEELKKEDIDTFVFFLDKRTDLRDVVNPLLYSPRVRLLDADAMIDVNSDVFAEIEAHRNYYRVFMAVLSRATVSLLQTARQLEILSAVQSWVIVNTDMDMTLLMTYVNASDNVVVIDARGRFQEPRLPPSLEILRDKRVLAPSTIDLYHAIRILLPPAAERLNGNRSLYPCSENDTESYFKDATLRLHGMTSLAVWTTSADSSSMVLTGYLNPYAKERFPTSIAKPFTGFHGRVFHITTVPNKIFQILQEDGTYRGLAFDVLHQLARTLNFTFKITPPEDGIWGAEDANGTWVGMVGMVMNKEVDFAVGSFTITAARESVIDFTIPYWHGSTGMLMRTRSEPKRLLVYLSPFKTSVWACILAAFPVSTAALWVILHAAPKRARSLQRQPINYMDTRGDGQYGNSDSLPGFLLLVLFNFGIQCQQTAPWLPIAASGRAIVGVLWLFSLVLAATYTGNLVAFLAVPVTDVPVDTLRDLTRQTEFKVGLVHGQALYNVLQNAPAGVYSDIWRKVSESTDNVVDSLAEGSERLLAGDFIFLDDTKNLVAVQADRAAEGDCALYIARQKFYFTGYGFPLQPGSPYLHIFNQGLMRMMEAGLVQRWMRQYWPEVAGLCGGGGRETARPAARPVSTSHTSAAFYVLLLGLALALVAFTFERLLARHTGKGVDHKQETVDSAQVGE